MAKAGFWLRGSRGKLAGASLGKGANGQTIIREVVTPKNPRTESQQVQRIIMKTVMQAYSTMKAITDHSFEGIAPGAATMAEFMRRNLTNLRNRVASEISQGQGYDDMWAFTPLKSEQYAPNTYIISKGQLPVVSAFTGRLANDAYITGLAANTYQAVLDTYGLQRGDQLTFVAIQGTTPAKVAFFFQRVILDPRNADGTEAPLSSPFVGADNKINLPNPRNEGNFTHLAYNSGEVHWYNNQQAFCAAGVIVSRRDGESWLRSNCTLVIDESNIATWPTLGECLSLLEEGDIETRSKLYLNNAGAGRTAQNASTNLFNTTTKAGAAVTLVGLTTKSVTTNPSEDDPVTYPNAPVAVDTQGNEYFIKLSITDSKYYNGILVQNYNQMDGAWDYDVVGQTNANTIDSGDYTGEPDSFWAWLFSQGINPAVLIPAS